MPAKPTKRKRAAKKIIRPAVPVKPYSYQPSKTELEEEIHLMGTPEDLAKAVLRDVKIKLDK